MTARNKNIPALRFKGFEEDWSSKRIGEVVNYKSAKYNPGKERKSYNCIELEHLSSNTGILLGYTDSISSASIKNKFGKGDILFGKLRPYLKKFLFAPFDGVCSSEIWVLNGISISNEFLYSFIQTDFFIDLANQSTGSKMPRADWNVVSSGIFNFPSLPEQQKIASFLSAIDEKIRQLTKKKELLEQYKKGVMQQLFSGKLRFKDEQGKAYAKWEEKTLNSLPKLIHGDGDWILSENIGSSEKYSIIQLGNIGYGRFIDKPMKTLSEENFKIIRGTLIKKGDLLLNRMVDVNVNACVFKYEGLYVTSVDVCWIRQGDEINNFFLSNLILTKEYQKKLLSLSSGSGRVRISKNNLFEKFRFKLPCMEEQQKIASFLSSLDTKIESVSAQIEGTQRFKKGLLQQMFV